MEIIQPSLTEFEPIKNLLSTAALPTIDLTPDHLQHFLVARDNGSLAGAGGLEIFGRDAMLRSVVVEPGYRERGLGSHLVHRLEEQARQHGVAALYLLTTSAERFFSQLGYWRIDRSQVPSKIQTTEAFTKLCPDSAVCMQINL